MTSAAWRRRCRNTRAHRVFLSSPDRSDYMNRESDPNFKGIAASRQHYEISACISITSRDVNARTKALTQPSLCVVVWSGRFPKDDGMKQRGERKVCKVL